MTSFAPAHLVCADVRVRLCGQENMRALCDLLRTAAIDREVLAAVSNKNIHQVGP